MLTSSRAQMLLVGAVGLCAACQEITTVDQSVRLRASNQVALHAAGGAGATQICHRTNGTQAFLLLRVGASAVNAHLAHGDHLAVTYYRIGSPTDTVVACAPPPGYSENPNDCAPVYSFTDSFDGAILDPRWSLTTDVVNPAQLCSGEACGEEQSGAYRSCIGAAPTMTVSFDFHTDADSSLEALAMFSTGQPFDPGSNTYFLGVDGGWGGGLIIRATGAQDNDGPGELVPPIDAGLQVGAVYHLVATVTASGALTVEVFQGSTLMARRDAQASGPIAVSNVGFIVGRYTDGFLTYLDNFSFTSGP